MIGLLALELSSRFLKEEPHDSESEADACLSALRKLWSRVQGSVMNDPRVRILTLVEEGQLSS